MQEVREISQTFENILPCVSPEIIILENLNSLCLFTDKYKILIQEI